MAAWAEALAKGPLAVEITTTTITIPKVDVTRNVMQIVIPTANRIEIRVLDGEGKLRSEGSESPSKVRWIDRIEVGL